MAGFGMKQVRTRKTGLLFRAALVVSGLLISPAWSAASADAVFALRNHNPFLQIFGLPAFQTATLASSDAPVYAVGLDLANNADFGESDAENFVIDGESYFLSLSFRRRMTDWLEIGADVPFVSHDGGFMDSGIRNWHDMFGMSNTKRRGEDDQLRFLYERNGATLYDQSSSASGVGDIRLSAAIPLREARQDGYALTVRSSLKLPTGDETKLLGSGAADVAVGLYGSGTRSMFNRPLGLTGFAGALVLGDGDVLAGQQSDVVPFGGVAAAWWIAERLALSAQVQAQGAYFDSDVDELGGSTVQLDVGLTYRQKASSSCLKFAVIEDIQADATTDFGLHFSFVARCGAP
jgi:hypothetical protein